MTTDVRSEGRTWVRLIDVPAQVRLDVAAQLVEKDRCKPFRPKDILRAAYAPDPEAGCWTTVEKAERLGVT